MSKSAFVAALAANRQRNFSFLPTIAAAKSVGIGHLLITVSSALLTVIGSGL